MIFYLTGSAREPSFSQTLSTSSNTSDVDSDSRSIREKSAHNRFSIQQFFPESGGNVRDLVLELFNCVLHHLGDDRSENSPKLRWVIWVVHLRLEYLRYIGDGYILFDERRLRTVQPFSYCHPVFQQLIERAVLNLSAPSIGPISKLLFEHLPGVVQFLRMVEEALAYSTNCFLRGIEDTARDDSCYNWARNILCSKVFLA